MAKINLVTKSLTTVNRVRINLYEEPDRTTVVDSLTFSTPHPQRIWTFFNLIPGQDYFFKWSEIDAGGLDIQVYASATFSIPASGSIEVRQAENITVGVSPGITAGDTSAVFDGTGGRPDFRGWEIIPFVFGTGPLEKNADYTWNAATGDFAFVQIGVGFYDAVRYFFEFLPKVVPVSNQVIVRDAWSDNFDITDDVTLVSSDFGKNGIIKGNDGYLKITLPDIFDVQPNKLLYLDSSTGSHKCAEITCSAATGNANLMQWPSANRQSIYMGISESIAVYREKVSNTISYWRFKFADGNFKTAGEIIYEYGDTGDVINKLLLDGSVYNSLEYARLYNDYIQNLGASDVVAYASWSTGTNIYKFSHADGSGNFHVPDLRGKYLRQVGASDSVADYLANQNKSHDHVMHGKGEIAGGGGPFFLGRATTNYSGGGGDGFGRAPGHAPETSLRTGDDGATEARPETVLVNVYVRV